MVTRILKALTGVVLLLLAALAPAAAQAQAQEIKVTLLGTGDPNPVMNRFGPSILVEAGGQTSLFDPWPRCCSR